MPRLYIKLNKKELMLTVDWSPTSSYPIQTLRIRNVCYFQVDIFVAMENRIKMYFEEEGCSCYSNRNIYATEVQKLELECIKKVFRGMVNAA